MQPDLQLHLGTEGSVPHRTGGTLPPRRQKPSPAAEPSQLVAAVHRGPAVGVSPIPASPRPGSRLALPQLTPVPPKRRGLRVRSPTIPSARRSRRPQPAPAPTECHPAAAAAAPSLPALRTPRPSAAGPAPSPPAPGLAQRGRSCSPATETDEERELSELMVERDKGFNRMQRTLGWVVSRVEQRQRQQRSAGELATAWDEVSRWLLRYFDDTRITQTAQTFVELLAVSRKDTAAYVQPCNARVYNACVGLEHLLHSTVRVHPGLTELARLVRTEIHGAIFTSPPALADAAASPAVWISAFQGRKTYFQACRMLSKRVTDKMGDIAAQGEVHEKEVGAADRVVLYWKRHLSWILFRGWRELIRRRKETTELKREIAELERVRSELLQGQSDGQARVAAAEARRKKAEEQYAKLRHETDALSNATMAERERVRELTQDVKDLQAEVELAQSRAQDLAGKAEGAAKQMRRLLLASHQRECGTPFEQARRAAFSDLLDFPGDEGKVLQRWLNRGIVAELMDRKLRGVPDPESLCLPDFCQGARSVRSYWCLLAFLSPAHVQDEELKKALTDHDLKKMARKLVARAEDLGLSTGVPADALCENTAEQHEVFVTAIFARFCGATYADSVELQGRGKAAATPLESLEGPQLEHAIETARLVSRRWAAFAARVKQAVWTRVSEVMKTGVSATLSASELKDQPRYTTLKTELVADLFDEDEEAPDGVLQEIAEVEALIAHSFRRLRKVFYHYAGIDGAAGEDCSMSADEFWRMCADAKIPDKAFNRDALRKLFDLVVSALPAAQETGEPAEGIDLDPQMFIAALLRIAVAKFKKSTGSTADKLRLLLEKHVLLYCCATEKDEFKQSVYQSVVQNILVRNKPKLKKVFMHYAQQEKAGGTFSQAVHELGQADFIKLIKDINAMDSTCTVHSVEAMFKAMFGDQHTPKMLYHEFLEAVCGIAVYKFPNPFTPLHKKVHQFLDQFVFALLHRRLKFQPNCA